MSRVSARSVRRILRRHRLRAADPRPDAEFDAEFAAAFDAVFEAPGAETIQDSTAGAEGERARRAVGAHLTFTNASSLRVLSPRLHEACDDRYGHIRNRTRTGWSGKSAAAGRCCIAGRRTCGLLRARPAQPLPFGSWRITGKASRSARGTRHTGAGH